MLGRHVIVDGAGVAFDTLNDEGYLHRLLREACEACGAEVLDCRSHHFDPQGVTAVAILAESHASIHTYPEHGVWMADIFTCGDPDPFVAVNHLTDALGGHHATRLVVRPIDTAVLGDLKTA